MKTTYKVIIAICCVLLAGCITAAVVLLMPNRTTADNDEVDPSEVDKFTVDEEYKDVLAEIKAEMPDYYMPELSITKDTIQSMAYSVRDYSITEDSIAGMQLFDGHLFADWETNGFDETKLMSLHIKEAVILQYRRYLCEQYLSEEYADDQAIKTWLAYRIDELSRMSYDIRDATYKNQPPYTGYGGEPGGGPMTTEPFVPETVIPVTPMPEA